MLRRLALLEDTLHSGIVIPRRFARPDAVHKVIVRHAWEDSGGSARLDVRGGTPRFAPCLFALYSPILVGMFDPDAHIPRLNKSMIYLGACLIAGIRLARERQVNVRVRPTSAAIDESVDLAHEIYNRVFRKVPEKVEQG